MKLSAHKFAKAFWIAAVVFVIAQQLAYLAPTFFISMGNALIYAGSLAAMGAIIHLLGEIRDQLAKRP